MHYKGNWPSQWRLYFMIWLWVKWDSYGLIFAIFASLLIPGSCSMSMNATILEAPKSVNISENDEIFLNCTAICDHINWKANGTPVIDFVALGFDNSYLPRIVNASTNVRIARLKIQGSKYISETKVTCHVSQLHEDLTSGVVRYTTAESEPALIKVQGLLNPVTNLSISIDGNDEKSAMITWTPPYTLMNVPILSYTVDVNVGSSTSLSIDVDTNTSTSSNRALVHWANRETFSNVHVAVRPVNKAGKGKIAATSTELPVNFATTGLPQNIPQGDDVQCDSNSQISIVVAVIICSAIFVASYAIVIFIALVLLYRNIRLQKQIKELTVIQKMKMPKVVSTHVACSDNATCVLTASSTSTQV